MNIVITGGSNGLGRALIDNLYSNNTIYNLDIRDPSNSFPSENYIQCDVSDHGSVAAAFNEIPEIDILINNAGINHIAWLEDENCINWSTVMDTNAKSIFLTSKKSLEKLTKSKGTILNIISNASHMAMTTSLVYNASKGAAHIMTLQLARELTKKNGITVFGISPAKIEGTLMSEYIDQTVPEMRGWTPEQSRQYQLNGLVTGEEIPAQSIAEFIAYLLESKENHKHFSGCIIPYGA